MIGDHVGLCHAGVPGQHQQGDHGGAPVMGADDEQSKEISRSWCRVLGRWIKGEKVRLEMVEVQLIGGLMEIIKIMLLIFSFFI